MKVIQGLDNQDLNSEEDQASAECMEMEVDKGVEIKSKMAEEDVNINKDDHEEHSMANGEETNGHDLNGVDETKAGIGNGVNNCDAKDSDKSLPETKSDSPITTPQNKDAEVETEDDVDDDSLQKSDKEESGSAYESATTGGESPPSLDETFESAKSEQVYTCENVKPTEDIEGEIETSEDLMNDLEKLTENENEIENQDKLLDSGDDETESEKKSSEASPTNLLQDDDNEDTNDSKLEEMPLSSSVPEVKSENIVEEESKDDSVIEDKFTIIKDKEELNNESIEDDEITLCYKEVSTSGDDLEVKMEYEDTGNDIDTGNDMDTKNVEKVNDITGDQQETTSIELEPEKEKASEPEKEKSVDDADKEPEKEEALEDAEKVKHLDGTEKEPGKEKALDTEKDTALEDTSKEKDPKVTDEEFEKESSKDTTDENSKLTEVSSNKDSTDGTMDVDDDECTIVTAETPVPAVDLDEALSKLDEIRDNIFNDDNEDKSDKKAGSKRGLSESTESQDIDSKKAKMSNAETETDIIDEDKQPEDETSAESEAEKAKQLKATKKSLKKQIKKLTRSELESILSVKMVEMMTNKSEMGKLRQQCDSYRDIMEKWKKRAESLRKQCTDLSKVMRKYIVDSKNNQNKDKVVVPIKIPRSVGLQWPPGSDLTTPLRGMGAGRGQLIRKGPGRPPGSSPSKPINTGIPPRIQANVQAATKLLPKVAQNGVVRNGVSPARSPAAANVAPRPVVSTPQPRPNWQMGGTTIMVSPSKASTPPTQPSPATVQTTVTPAPQPSTSKVATVATATKTIDVVDLDLSDDEDKPAPAPAPPPQRQMHTVQRGMVRPGFAGRGGQGFRMTSDERLVPVQPQQQIIRQQNQPRMMHRPMMVGRPRPSISRPSGPRPLKHPAPLPPIPQHQPSSPGWPNLPNRPSLKLNKSPAASGIVLSWSMQESANNAPITFYQLYAYQESNQQRPDPSLWKKVGDVKALPLPMACTLTQFSKGNKYHFAVRAMDNHQRVGNFSEPSSIFLNY